MKFVMIYLVLTGIISFFLVGAGIYLLVEVNEHQEGVTKKLGNVFGSITLVGGLLFAVMSWIGFKEAVRLNPFIENLADRIAEHVPEGTLHRDVEESAQATDRPELANHLKKTAHFLDHNPRAKSMVQSHVAQQAQHAREHSPGSTVVHSAASTSVTTVPPPAQGFDLGVM